MILAKYGVACIISFPLIKAGSNNFAGTGDYTEASGDVKIIKDRAAGGANATNSMGANLVGNSTEWALQLTATEMQAKEVVVKIADAATKAIEDTQINIYTYGDANAWIPFDLSQATPAVNVTQVNTDTNAAAQLALMFAGNMTYGTAQVGSTSTTIKLAAGSSSVTDYFANSTVCIVSGTGAGQTPKRITAYDGTTKVATVDSAWATTPDATSKYQIIGRIA